MTQRRFNASKHYVIPQRIVGFDELPIADSDQVVRVPRIQAHQGLAVAPAGFWDFSDEEIVAGLASGVEWTDVNPRAGLADEVAWKAERDAMAPTKGKQPARGPADGATEDTNEDTPAGDANGDGGSPQTEPAAAGNEKE